MELQATVVNNYLDKITDFGFEYAPKLIGGILVLFIGLWVTNLITKALGKSLEKSNIDQSLVPFLRSITNIILKVLRRIWENTFSN